MAFKIDRRNGDPFFIDHTPSILDFVYVANAPPPNWFYLLFFCKSIAHCGKAGSSHGRGYGHFGILSVDGVQ